MTSAYDDAADETTPERGTGAGADDAAPAPTVLQRARALWCQLVSGLG